MTYGSFTYAAAAYASRPLPDAPPVNLHQPGIVMSPKVTQLRAGSSSGHNP